MPIYKEGGKRDGLQRYRVTVSYTAPSGEYKQISRVAYGSDAARQLESDLRREAASGTASRMTVAELVERFNESKRADVREQSLFKAMSIQRCHILPTLGGERLDKLTARKLDQWKTAMNAKGLSLTMRRNAFSELRALLLFAVQMDYLQVSPLKNVQNFRDSGDDPSEKRLRYYTADEFRQYIAVHREAAEASGDWRYYVFFCVAFYTGMRKGEMHALKWSDVDGNVIHVRRSIAQKLGGGDRETKPKTKSSIRDLQIPSPLMEILDAHRARQMRDPAFSEDWRVIGGAQCLRDTGIDHRNRSAAASAGLRRITVHEFRHSHASLLANEGISLSEIARRLGHSSIRETERTYAHLYPREEERAIRVLDAVHV